MYLKGNLNLNLQNTDCHHVGQVDRQGRIYYNSDHMQSIFSKLKIVENICWIKKYFNRCLYVLASQWCDTR